MKVGIACLAIAWMCAACGSLSPRPPSPRLGLYLAHAGSAVLSFPSFGRIDRWEPLGDGVLAVWTRPNEAWLLDLFGACPELEYSISITLTEHAGMVESGSDEVRVMHASPDDVGCTIRTIRPLDVAAIRNADRAATQQQATSPQSH